MGFRFTLNVCQKYLGTGIRVSHHYRYEYILLLSVYIIDKTQMMNKNFQIDVDSVHIGPTIACNSTQNVDTEIKVQCCEVSDKVKPNFIG